MRVLIDTNVLLDVLDNREKYFDGSYAVWELCFDKKVRGYISALSIPNIVYIMRRELDPPKIENLILNLTDYFSAVNLKMSDTYIAAGMRFRDFEDAIQMTVAQRIGADFIVTRNIRDFADSKVPALKPEELLERI